MQQAALTFMHRHQSEHLGDDQQLFTRAVTHLQAFHEVPVYLAETLASLAYSELRVAGTQRHLDISSSSSSVAILSDPASGKSFAVPVAMIFQVLIDPPDIRPNRPVD
ncbi:hypothetical protein [Pseudomonas baltica]|uniref:hypothetical protein n=1 Tax=Pseudomonas baltica TaxID=2762576 RepID=UPI0028A1D41D|nr:hypothetical protein [Pseudomonas baltica]